MASRHHSQVNHGVTADASISVRGPSSLGLPFENILTIPAVGDAQAQRVQGPQTKYVPKCAFSLAAQLTAS